MSLISFPYLPEIATFLFVFALVFGLLSKAGTFGDKKINGMLAAVIAAFSLMSSELVLFMSSIMPIAAVLLVIGALVLFIKDAFKSKDRDSWPQVIVLAIGLALLGVFWDTIGSYVPFEYRDATLGGGGALWGVGLLVIVLIFYAAYKHNPGK